MQSALRTPNLGDVHFGLQRLAIVLPLELELADWVKERVPTTVDSAPLVRESSRWRGSAYFTPSTRSWTDSGFIPVLLFSASLIAIALWTYHSGAPMGPGYETLAIARNLANNGEFANPFAPLPTGPTAHCAPVYPYFLAMLIRMFGNTSFFVLAAYLCTMSVHAFSIALLPRISDLFFGDGRPGIYGAILSIPLPLFVLFPQYELAYVAAGVMCFCLATDRLGQRGGSWRGLLAGLFLGLLLLLNPAAICLAAPWLGYLLWRGRIAQPRRFLICAGLAAISVLTPWTIRNYRQFDKLFFIRDNLGLELYIANNDQAQGSYYLNHQSSEGHARLHPNNSEEQAREVLRMGEIRYAADRMATARAWIAHHPGRFLSLTATRARMFWFPDADERPWNSRAVWLITLMSAAGFLLLARRRKPIVAFLGSVLLTYPLMYYCVQADIRYRAPILWISLLGSGYLITALTSRAGASRPGACRALSHAEIGVPR